TKQVKRREGTAALRNWTPVGPVGSRPAPARRPAWRRGRQAGRSRSSLSGSPLLPTPSPPPTPGPRPRQAPLTAVQTDLDRGRLLGVVGFVRPMQAADAVQPPPCALFLRLPSSATADGSPGACANGRSRLPFSSRCHSRGAVCNR